MTAIGIRAGIRDALVGAPIVGFISGLCGYTYAKFASMEAGQVAIAYSVLAIVESIFTAIASSCTDDFSTKKWIKVACLTGGSVGILELYRRNLMGQVAMIVVVALRALYCVNLCVFAKKPVENLA